MLGNLFDIDIMLGMLSFDQQLEVSSWTEL